MRLLEPVRLFSPFRLVVRKETEAQKTFAVKLQSRNRKVFRVNESGGETSGPRWTHGFLRLIEQVILEEPVRLVEPVRLEEPSPDGKSNGNRDTC